MASHPRICRRISTSSVSASTAGSGKHNCRTGCSTSVGIYVFNARFLFEQLIYDADDHTSSHDFGKDLIPRLVQRYRLFAHPFHQSCVNMAGNLPYWRDVGTVDAYWEANIELTRVTPALNLYDEEWPIWTNQEQLPPAKFGVVNQELQGSATESLVLGGLRHQRRHRASVAAVFKRASRESVGNQGFGHPAPGACGAPRAP